MNGISVVWLRRDLRLHDNTALNEALKSAMPVLPLFIFDTNIINELPPDDARLSFIYDTLQKIQHELSSLGSSLLVEKDSPLQVWEALIKKYPIKKVFVNKDYEPYAISRDQEIRHFFEAQGIECNFFKDQVIFEENEVLKNDGSPYTVFTPYRNKWMQHWQTSRQPSTPLVKEANFVQQELKFPQRDALGLVESPVKVKPFNLDQVDRYAKERDFPALDSTSYLSPHLRFGTVSVRMIIESIDPENTIFLNELIWREFFMQILYHFPTVVTQNFKAQYNQIPWRNNKQEFARWCEGTTGYPMVDAGMRQLNATGYMHNRVRMITAGFLCKHLLIDWRWGEAYFASKLLDYELSSNNGNWQWAAGTGCDAAPYFRVFNPTEQLKKFDPKLEYVRKWIPELDTLNYPTPIVEHSFARKRAIDTYKNGLQSQ